MFFLSGEYPCWNGRIPAEVKEYFQKKGISAGQIFIEYYKILKQQEIPELLQEKNELLKRVAQIDQIVTHCVRQKDEIVTHGELDEICQDYLKQGFNDERIRRRSLENPTSEDRDWIKARLQKKKLYHTIDQETFLKRCSELRQQEK